MVEAGESTYDASYILELNKVTLFNWLNCLIYNRSLHAMGPTVRQRHTTRKENKKEEHPQDF